MPISLGAVVTATSFNSIHSKVYGIITDYYGYVSPTPTRSVSTGSVMLSTDWRNLYLDLARCNLHQTNSLPVGVSEPVVEQIITAQYRNALDLAADVIVTNKDLVHPSQVVSQSITDVRTTNWNSEIQSKVEFTFSSPADVDYFLNLGGAISLDFSYSPGTYSGDDLYWKNIFDALIVKLASEGNIFDKNSDSGPIKEPDLVPAPGDQVVIDRERVGNKITIFVQIKLGSSMVLTIKPSVVYTVSYSTINTASPSPYGVPSPQPVIIPKVGLDNTLPAPPVSKILSVTPNTLTYNFGAFQTSNVQTVVVTNIGNSAVTISALEVPTVAGISAIVNSGAIVGVLSAGQSKNIQLSYASSSAQTGTFNSQLRIISDNDQGVVTVPVVQNISVPVFNISLDPLNWINTVTDRSAAIQAFSIVPTPGTSISSYSASLSENHNLRFGLNTFGASPRVQFDPTQGPNATYKSTLTVVASFGPYLSTATADMIITRDVSESVTKNLGSWISAVASDNSVVGISYDLVDNVRYLTIGVGAGADGAPDVASGGVSYVSLQNLGIGSDLSPSSGPVLFKSPYDAFYTNFLNTYGAWVRSESNLPHNVEQVRSYIVNVEQAGNYTWTLAADNNCYFAIDDVIIGDRRTTEQQVTNLETGEIVLGIVPNNNAYTTDLSGEVYISAGSHKITIGVTNFGLPGAIGLRLVLSASPFTELWSTLTPIRSSIPYLYWAEVYRIPLTQGAVTYQAKDYMIKSGGYAGGSTYGSFMGTGSICSVVDDGFGNLSISFPTTFTVNNSTTRANTYLPWYYTEITGVNRVTQLETPPPPGGDSTQTRYFLGFDAQGSILTSLVPIPKSVVEGQPGGGGGPPIFFGGGGFLLPNLGPGDIDQEFTIDDTIAL